jgi:hypothetical protein
VTIAKMMRDSRRGSGSFPAGKVEFKSFSAEQSPDRCFNPDRITLARFLSRRDRASFLFSMRNQEQ